MSFIPYGIHEGGRSEYLAQYLLSSIASTVLVPRQEDSGFDSICYLKKNLNSVRMYFGNSMLLQIKSSSITEVSYGKPGKTWNKMDLEWLNSHQIPIFFCFVNKEKMKIELYTSSAFHFLRTQSINNPAQIVFKQGNHRGLNEDISFPQVTDLEEFQNVDHDGKKYTIDLGEPVITLDRSDMTSAPYQNSQLKLKLNILTFYVKIEQENIDFRNAGLNYMKWVPRITTNKIPDKTAALASTTVGKTLEDLVRTSPENHYVLLLSVYESLIQATLEQEIESLIKAVKSVCFSFQCLVFEDIPQFVIDKYHELVGLIKNMNLDHHFPEGTFVLRRGDRI